MSVYKRKAGDGKNRWYYDIKIKGRRYRSVIPEARTKYQAREAERRIRDQIFNGKYGKAQSSKTLGKFARETYLPWARENKRSWRNDFSRIKPILAYFGKKKMSEISPFEVERFKTIRSKSFVREGVQRSKAAVNRELALLSRVFTLAIQKREISFNPVSEVKMLKGEVRRTRYLLPEEEPRLMACLTGRRARLRLIVLIALNTGMRQGEILRLKRSNLDFLRGEILVTETKTDEDRIVPMNERLRSELMSNLSGLETEYLFPGLNCKGPMKSIESSWQSAVKSAGLEDFRFHDLRHTASTRMNEADHPEGPPTEILEIEDDSATLNGDDETIVEGEDDEYTPSIQDRLKQRTFVVASRALLSSPSWVLVSDIFKGEKTDWQLIKELAGSPDDPSYELYTKRLQRVRAIRNYMYVMQVLPRDFSYEEVAEIFVRVNSLGIKLRGSDLALALVTAKWPSSLRECFENQVFGDSNRNIR